MRRSRCRSKTHLWLDYTADNDFGVGVRYVGRRWNDEANTSAGGRRRPARRQRALPAWPWRYALNANNLFDRDYAASRAHSGYYPGSERNLLATVKYRF
ncbi:hypothetical protein [Lysobacter sp. 1R34A]|uniref:hypothetical protein n=1 Tax=Lysobacter sp. 1R34A TaxID=3445786 RepID=UPI003EE9EA05